MFPQVLLAAHAAAVSAAAGAVSLISSLSGTGTGAGGVPPSVAPEAALALREAALAEYCAAWARHVPPLLQVCTSCGLVVKMCPSSERNRSVQGRCQSPLLRRV